MDKLSSVVVDEFTTPSPVAVTPQTSLKQVAEIMDFHQIRHLPVTDNDQPVGIISDRDLKTIVNFNDLQAFTAADIMTDQPYTVSSDTSLEEVALTMSRKKIGSALILDTQDNSLGIFTLTDALNALIEILRGDQAANEQV